MKRDQASIKTYDDFKAFMRYNNYLHDPLCKSDPGQSILSRYDLRGTVLPTNNTRRAFGGIDSKVHPPAPHPPMWCSLPPTALPPACRLFGSVEGELILVMGNCRCVVPRCVLLRLMTSPAVCVDPRRRLATGIRCTCAWTSRPARPPTAICPRGTSLNGTLRSALPPSCMERAKRGAAWHSSEQSRSTTTVAPGRGRVGKLAGA